MGFHETAVYPTKLAIGSTFGWGFATTIVSTTTGAEYRTSRREVVRHSGDLSTGINGPEDLLVLKKFHMARRGALFGFRFKDPLDHLSNYDDPTDPLTVVSSTDQVLQPITGSTTEYQLSKTYDDGAGVAYTRKITKPIDGTVVVSIDDVDVSAANYTINTATGIIQFNTAPTGTVKAGFEFHTPVRFDADADEALEVAFREWKYGDIPRVGIVELLDEGFADEDVWNGGAANLILIGAETSIVPLNGRFLSVQTILSSRSVILPDAATLGAGGPIFFIQNSGAVSFDIKDDQGNVVQAAAAGSLYQLLIGKATDGSLFWLSVAS